MENLKPLEMFQMLTSNMEIRKHKYTLGQLFLEQAAGEIIPK